VLVLVLYDLTTLYFETPREDGLRKVGMSKDAGSTRRSPSGWSPTTPVPAGRAPLHLFEGNRAETKTTVPVLTEFRDQHPETADIIVVADAGLLSAANLLTLEEAGFRFIVGSKTSKAPYDLADHLDKHGNAFADGQTVETSRVMGHRQQSPHPDGWSGSGRSSGIDTTSRRSTRWSSAPRPSPPGGVR
jgi:hypothetical protein